jgi:hypothetical protein
MLESVAYEAKRILISPRVRPRRGQDGLGGTKSSKHSVNQAAIINYCPLKLNIAGLIAMVGKVHSDQVYLRNEHLRQAEAV